MSTFLNKDFLLYSEPAKELYHDYAAKMPIIDYHNHLSPQEIAENKTFDSLTEIWLKGDHYKWRAMRANGIDEHYITGAASDWEKFEKWAETVPYTMRNPLYHWTHLEQKRYFDIDTLLDKTSARTIYEQANAQLPSLSTQSILRKMRVRIACTTDDPIDDLNFHQQLAENDFEIKVLPAFRPDKAILIQQEDFAAYIQQLGEAADIEILELQDLKAALEKRAQYFHSMGCRLSDHGLEQMYASDYTEDEVNKILKRRLQNQEIFPGEALQYQSALLHFLGQLYHQLGWTQQFHLGALRNNNDRLLSSIGADVGCDSIGDFKQAIPLSRFLNRLDTEDKLTKTILYNLNPRDNEVFATMAGNYGDGRVPGKMQWGSAWWFLDQKDGMEKQIDALSNMGLLSRFIGMLTDSRSFLSFPRHEYFRRILCNKVGEEVAKGELPNDLKWLGEMIENICYYNAERYFEFAMKGEVVGNEQ